MALFKCNIFFAFISQFKVYCATYCAIYGAVVKQHMITTPLIISYHNNVFLNNDTPFNVALFYVALFDVELS